MNQYEFRIGYWNAVICVVLIALFYVGMILSTILFPMTAISSIQDYKSTFNNLQMIPLIPSFLFVLFFVVLMVSVKTYANENKKIWGQLSYSFSVISASILSLHYYIQLTIVRQGLLNNELTGLWQFSAPNPHSFFWVLSALGYGMMGISLLLAAQIFQDKSEKIIKWLFIINGINGIMFLIGNILGFFVIDIIASTLSMV